MVLSHFIGNISMLRPTKTITPNGRTCDLSSTAQCGVQCQGKGYASLPGHHQSPAAGDIPPQTNMLVCGWQEDAFWYWSPHQVRSRTTGCTLLFPQDIQNVLQCIQWGRLAPCAPDFEWGGSRAVLGLGVQAGDEYHSNEWEPASTTPRQAQQ